jgi:hypothetical protein
MKQKQGGLTYGMAIPICLVRGLSTLPTPKISKIYYFLIKYLIANINSIEINTIKKSGIPIIINRNILRILITIRY